MVIITKEIIKIRKAIVYNWVGVVKLFVNDRSLLHLLSRIGDTDCNGKMSAFKTIITMLKCPTSAKLLVSENKRKHK